MILKKINCIGFKTLSKELVFILANNSEIQISFSDVTNELKRIDWNHEYSSLNVEDILNDGIDAENLSVEFLKSVTDISQDEDNVYLSKKLGLYFQFEQGILKAVSSTEWDNSSTKWLNDINSSLLSRMKQEASIYQDNELEVMEEVNKQTDSLLGIPSAMENEFIPLHRTMYNNINFYNLLISHYDLSTNLTEFLFMNKGRYKQIDGVKYEVGEFIYEFDLYDNLQNVERK